MSYDIFIACSSLFTNSNWLSYQDGEAPVTTSPSDMMDDINLNGTSNSGNSSSDDEVVVGEGEGFTESKSSANGLSSSESNTVNGFNMLNSVNEGLNEKTGTSNDVGFFHFESPDIDDPFGDRPIPEWVAWGEASDFQVGGSSVNPFDDQTVITDNLVHSSSASGDSMPNGTPGSADSVTVRQIPI